MIILVISDLHLGRGKFFKSGDFNVLEDFHEDEKFEEFLKFYSTGKYEEEEVTLVLNGDIVNLIQIDVDGVFASFIDETLVCDALEKIRSGHPHFFDALSKFAQTPKKSIHYIIGNHDAGMAFEKAKNTFISFVGAPIEFSFVYYYEGVYIEHGHQYEVINSVPSEDYFKTFLGRRVLNLPWGTLFCIHLLPLLKKKKPFIDKVRPLSSYIRWYLINDTFGALQTIYQLIKYFIATHMNYYTRENQNFKTTLAVLKQITVFPKFGKIAQRLFRSNPNLHTVILGHSHLSEWRRFPESKYYFNSGTWNIIPSIDIGQHESIKKLHYIYVDITQGNSRPTKAAILSFHGEWRPFTEEVTGRF